MNALRLSALLAISGGLIAAVSQAESLADKSPFLPSGVSGNTDIGTGAKALELRGVTSGSAGSLFYVYDPVKKQGVWACSTDTEDSFTIVAGDANEGELEIRMNDGRHLHLKLKEAKILAGGMGPAGAPPANAVVGANPNPPRLTEEQAAWREEFNRRVAENGARQ